MVSGHLRAYGVEGRRNVRQIRVGGLGLGVEVCVPCTVQTLPAPNGPQAPLDPKPYLAGVLSPPLEGSYAHHYTTNANTITGEII